MITKRTKKEVEEEGKRKPKVKEAFRIQKNTDSVWYSKDGSTYSADKKLTKFISKHEHLQKIISELEEVIAKKEEVVIVVFINLLLNIYFTHYLFFCSMMQIKRQLNGRRSQSC